MTRRDYLALLARIKRGPSRGYVAARERKRKKDGVRAIADAKWAAGVKVRAGMRCEWDGCLKRWKGLQAHHFFTRSIKATRHDPENGVSLCKGHHIYGAHKYPHQFRAMMIAIRGQAWFDALEARAKQRGIG